MTYWTRQALRAYGRGACGFADQHVDYFTRNILVSYPGSNDLNGDAARAANEYRSNMDHQPWPTYEDVAQWGTSNGYPAQVGEDGTTNTAAMEWALKAATSRISEATHLDYYVVDADGAVTADKEIAKIPFEVWLATVMQAFRWYRRRITPDGSLGASAFGGVVRVGRFDPDVEEMLRNYRFVGIA